jgi:hypothetical protein
MQILSCWMIVAREVMALAGSAGVSPANLQRYERGKRAGETPALPAPNVVALVE